MAQVPGPIVSCYTDYLVLPSICRANVYKKKEGILAPDDVPEIGTGYCIGYRIGMDLVNLMERSNPTEKGSNPREKLILRGLNPSK